MKNPTQNVLNFSNVPSFTSGLQEAIDALPESGGVVEVPPGIYTLQRHVRLRNNVLIRGSGNASRITRTAEVSSPLAQEANDGDVAVQVESAKAFNPGMEISIFDTTL